MVGEELDALYSELDGFVVYPEFSNGTDTDEFRKGIEELLVGAE